MARMPFFFDAYPERYLTLKGQDALHVDKVLRMKAGEKLYLFDGKGREYETLILSIDKKGVHLEFSGIKKEFKEAETKLDISIALLKGNKIDELIPSLTELGVSTIRVFSSKRSVGQIKKDKLKARLMRWERIALESLKQCGAAFLPEIFFYETKEDLLSDIDKLKEKNTMRVLFWENADKSLWPEDSSVYGNISAIFGPEGGFEREEADFFLKAGYKSLGLGPRVLKAPTAIIAGSALLQFKYGDLFLAPMAS